MEEEGYFRYWQQLPIQMKQKILRSLYDWKGDLSNERMNNIRLKLSPEARRHQSRSNAAKTIQKAWTFTVPHSSGLLTSGRAQLQFTNPTWQRWQGFWEQNPLRDKIYRRMAQDIDLRGAAKIRDDQSVAWRNRHEFDPLDHQVKYMKRPLTAPGAIAGVDDMSLSDIQRVFAPTRVEPFFMGLTQGTRPHWQSRLKSASLNDGRAGVRCIEEGRSITHPRFNRKYQQTRVGNQGAGGRNREFENSKFFGADEHWWGD